MAPLLEIRGLSYLSLLKNVTFRVEKGEHLLIVGQNGAGKSTLLRCLDRIADGWTGEILFNGVSVRKIPRKRYAQKIAYVRQGGEVISDMTVRNLVLTGRYPHRGFFAPISRRDESIAENALRLTETDTFADRKFASLSGGERQRVWLAAAVAQEPDLFLLDEPAVYLDCRRRNEIERLLDKIRRETGAALIEVTHDLNRAADSILALKEGKVLYYGDPAGILCRGTLREIFETELDVMTFPGCGRPIVMPGKASSEEPR